MPDKLVPLPVHEEQDENGTWPRIYFLTGSRLYELVFRWTNLHDEFGDEQDPALWRGQVTEPLLELPFTGFDLFLMSERVYSGGNILLHVSTLHRPYWEPTRCMPLRAPDQGEYLPFQVLFITPCYSTPEIHRYFEEEGAGWQFNAYRAHVQSQAPAPPLPAELPLKNEGGEPLFDLMTVGRHWDGRTTPSTRLTYTQATELARSIDESEGALIFRYYGEPDLPQEKRDSLEWLNPSYCPWTRRVRFHLQDRYFETDALLAGLGIFGEEVLPSEVFQITTFSEVGERTRLFGKRDEARMWAKQMASNRACLTHLVPDPDASFWVFSGEDHKLHDEAFRKQGEAEWLK